MHWVKSTTICKLLNQLTRYFVSSEKRLKHLYRHWVRTRYIFQSLYISSLCHLHVLRLLFHSIHWLNVPLCSHSRWTWIQDQETSRCIDTSQRCLSTRWDCSWYMARWRRRSCLITSQSGPSLHNAWVTPPEIWSLMSGCVGQERIKDLLSSKEENPSSIPIQKTKTKTETQQDITISPSLPQSAQPSTQYQYRVIPPTSPRTRSMLPPRVLTIAEWVSKNNH